jgi:hypothetical protein
MKKYALILILAAVSCSQNWNDLVHGEVVAEFTAFEIEGQESCMLRSYEKKITVTMPAETDLKQLKVKKVSYTEGAVLSPDIAVGSVLDLSEPVEIVLMTYDPYKWTINAELAEVPQRPDEPDIPDGPAPGGELTAEGPQLYNMGFDLWSHYPDNEAIDLPCAADASDDEKLVWASGGQMFAAMDTPAVLPEREFLAVEGEEKAALKLLSLDYSAYYGKLVYGTVFNGVFNGANMFSNWSLMMEWGTPFTARPAALEGYACYKPQSITFAEAPYAEEMGNLDKGHILVLLTDWDARYTVNPPETLVDLVNDPAIIGYGKVVFDSEMDDYERFQINISYRNERTPKYITIVMASSSYGDFFTGAPGSILYVDELALLYEQE